LEKFCSTVIHAAPRWGIDHTSLIVEASYQLPDGHMYVVEYECPIERTEGVYVHPEGQTWEKFQLVVPGKEWLDCYNKPNNYMIGQMLYHVVLLDMRRNILKILRAQYEPQHCVVPQSRAFRVRLDNFAVYMDVNGKYGLVP
jgi:hypothetical protein